MSLTELPEEQCEFCKELLLEYAVPLGYLESDVEKALPHLKPIKSWITKGKGGSQMITYYFKCPKCFPLIKKGWKVVERRYDVRVIGK